MKEKNPIVWPTPENYPLASYNDQEERWISWIPQVT
jgi:hypothetical protein